MLIPCTSIATFGSWRRSTADRKSTRLNSSHGYISYAVFCLKKKNSRLLSVAVPVLLSTRRIGYVLHQPSHQHRLPYVRLSFVLPDLAVTATFRLPAELALGV